MNSMGTPGLRHRASPNWLQAMQRGRQAFQQGQFKRAIRHFSLAVEIFPVRAEGWVNLGLSQVRSGASQTGLESLQRAIALDPNLMMAHMATGDIHRQLGNWKEMIHAYRHAVELERTPASLNKLACALRVARHPEEAESLYQEALRLDPDYTLARVNLATIQVELQHFDKARTLLSALRGTALSPQENTEVESARLALEQYFAVQPGLELALQEGDFDLLYRALRNIPASLLQADKQILDGIRRYLRSANSLSFPPPAWTPPMPEDWSLIEALFMHPSVSSLTAYQQLKIDMAKRTRPTDDLLKSTNIEAMILAMRAARNDLSDPLKAEMHLRHWHALAAQGIEGMAPGQYKLTSNIARGSTMERAMPHRVAGTIRAFFSEIYTGLPAGLTRALVSLMAILDIHGFDDGNGRVGLTLMNRELEWAGEIPVLLRRDTQTSLQYFNAIRAVHNNGGDLTPLVTVIRNAQKFSLQLSAALARLG